MSLGSVRKAQRELTRERLIYAARKIFERDGYGQASIGDIAAQAEINRSTFYLHFQNKAEVFVALQGVVWAEERLDYLRILNSALLEGTHEAISRWIQASFEWYQAHGPLLIAWFEAMAIDTEVANSWQDHLQRTTEQYSEYLNCFEGKGRRKAEIRVQALMSQLDMLGMRWLVQRERNFDLDEVLPELVQIWLDTLPKKPV